MASDESKLDSFQLFPSSGFSFLDNSPEKPPHPIPPPPCIEVFISQVSPSVKPTFETVNFDGLTLLKGRVSTQEVFALSNSDLVPGKYEGGLKLWEGSLDLVRTLRLEVECGNLSLPGKKLLELGCGHGLPGIYSCLQGAAAVHFQDFNSEVLQSLTIPNVVANLRAKSKSEDTQADIRYFAGDWSEVHQILPNLQTDDQDMNCSSGKNKSFGYDIVLMAETVYSISTLPALYELIKKQRSIILVLEGDQDVSYHWLRKTVLWWLALLPRLGADPQMSVKYGNSNSSNIHKFMFVLSSNHQSPHELNFTVYSLIRICFILNRRIILFCFNFVSL